jgi:hypothetical protein
VNETEAPASGIGESLRFMARNGCGVRLEWDKYSWVCSWNAFPDSIVAYGAGPVAAVAGAMAEARRRGLIT